MEEEIDSYFRSVAIKIKKALPPNSHFYTHWFSGKAARSLDPRYGLDSMPGHLLSDSQILTISGYSDHRLTIAGISVGQRKSSDTKTFVLVSYTPTMDCFKIALEPSSSLLDIAVILSSISAIVDDFLVEDLFHHHLQIVHNAVHHYYTFGVPDDGEGHAEEYHSPEYDAIKALLCKSYNLPDDFPYTKYGESAFKIIDTDIEIV